MSRPSRKAKRTAGPRDSDVRYRHIIYTKYASSNCPVAKGEACANYWMALWTSLASYHIFELEITKDGRLHYQGYIEFKSQVARSKIKKLSENMHHEPRHGTSEEASGYCNKPAHPEYDDGSYVEGPWEMGIMKKTPQQVLGDMQKKNKVDWTAAVNIAMTGDIYGIRNLPGGDGLLTRHLPNYKTMARDNPVIPSDLRGVCGYWFYGGPSTGKTTAAKTRWGPSFYLKPHNKWWDSYRGEETVIINEFDSEQKWMGTHLKLWAEESAFFVEIKGSTIAIRPKRIVVTSNETINSIWMENPMMVKALQSRFKEELFTTVYKRVHVDDIPEEENSIELDEL